MMELPESTGFAEPAASLPGVPASVVVVSRGRPAELCRCLAALQLQDHAALEVVVVADAAGRAALARAGFAGPGGDVGAGRRAPPGAERAGAGGARAGGGSPGKPGSGGAGSGGAGRPADVKVVAFDEANISAARNLGIAAAAGEVVLFLDDDSVPEPPWAGRLVAAFDDPRIEAATGFVRGRNGISWQHRARWVDAVGRERPLEVEADAISLHQGGPGSAVKTEGTNMAFRRETLAALGGFDPAFRFYMDETDLNMRLAAMELITAVVPLAEVQHGFAASDRRRADRTPLDLHEIGASSAVFLRKHAGRTDPERPLAALMRAQRRRLLQAMVDGRLDPRDVGRLLAGLEAGIDEGLGRPLEPLLPIGPPAEPFRPLPGAGPRPARVLAGWWWQHRRLMRAARAHAAEGAVVTVLRFSPSPAAHRMGFADAGVWLQAGGLWGRSLRSQPRISPWRLKSRLQAELARLAPVRPVDTLLG